MELFVRYEESCLWSSPLWKLAERNIVVADGSGQEAALVPGAEVWVASSLREVVAVLRGSRQPRSVAVCEKAPTPSELGGRDLADVHGQATPRLAIEVAAAGAHHVFLHGAPGAGKTLLAERLPGLLPDSAARGVT